MTKNNTCLAALFGATVMILSACGQQADDHGHSHDGGAEHPHNGAADHGHEHEAPAPATEAIYEDGAAGNANTQTPEATTEEAHDHDHEHGDHGHDH